MIASQKRTSACDNCRRRKVRCNREQPCGKCQEVSLNCRYTSVARRKGPKGRSAPVLSALLSSTSSPLESTLSANSANDANLFPASFLEDQPILSLPEYRDFNIIGLHEIATPGVRQRMSTVLLQAHVKIFLEHLFPIMPVLDANSITLDSLHPETLSPRRYALLLALCAATHLQLNLDESDGSTFEEASPSGQSLIDQALRALQEFDPLDMPHIDSVLTSFFLFSAYGNLDKHHHAWHYLSQSISFAHLLNLHQEESYLVPDPEAAELRRRIYWLLFITERAYALQRKMPITLRQSIQKPSVFTSDSPALAYGFVNLISVFEEIPASLYDWNISAGSNGDRAALFAVYHSVALSTPLLSEYNETQKVDLMVTRQWLQIRLWNILNDQLTKTCDEVSVVPLDLPATAARSVMALMSTVSRKSANAHGIGIEQKLYDIGEAVCVLAHKLLPNNTGGGGKLYMDAQNVLCGLIDRLSDIRGSQSHLLAPLLQQSHDILGLGSLPPQLGFPSHLAPDLTTKVSCWEIGPDDDGSLQPYTEAC
ncbi:transcriptional regulator family: Fungal Specific TF [Penicillium concentricum]|uniref:Transcriptional regulator family: Fungal Specific TF n=1 Tax=Penicillium concentricum TaxID=293559 RepID=A0A9W9VK90_9EURO|nr:transcriptional regulator family: Fungal Specific TF [Penicillium concentricum]KAJ5382555.1 transcriptional regulator family: Fungal Specific TF [Penicillium concentricum]